MSQAIDLSEITIAGLQAGYAEGRWTAVDVVRWYLDRIRTLDRDGPALHAMISTNDQVEAQAAELDRRFASEGPVGPLHGVPVLIKDQIDVTEMPTTMGSVVFRANYPRRDAFVITKLRAAGALMLGKTTLGEMGSGDAHGSLFGSARNVYDLDRTAGGSSGGSGSAVSANFGTVALGQEGYASIRRPAIWNGVVGMRPSGGLVSRGNVYDGWPSTFGSIGPMCRTVEDAARLLDVIVGYDPHDPMTALGHRRYDGAVHETLRPDALKGVRLGVLRTPIGYDSEPDAADFKRVEAVFERGLHALVEAGAALIDPIEIEGLNDLMALRAGHPTHSAEAVEVYTEGLAELPFRTKQEIMASPDFEKVTPQTKVRWASRSTAEAYGRYLEARDTLMTRLLKVMADLELDAIVHKAIEHEPTLIADGVNPPHVDLKGAPHLNTFLGSVPSIAVPAGMTTANLPAGMAFLGRPYDDANVIRYAYAFERHCGGRVPPQL
jgi:Asp-tRNA(Asn)/Glu-tRNA(Gln) amidotransferase A subunit family amidase